MPQDLSPDDDDEVAARRQKAFDQVTLGSEIGDSFGPSGLLFGSLMGAVVSFWHTRKEKRRKRA
jgi:hypothetical protein